MVQEGTGPARPSEELSLPAIITAAVRLLDVGGVEGLSMRSLAAALERSHTAAYRHVTDKDELLLLAADAVLDDADVADPADSWDDRLRVIVRHSWHSCWKPHPWLADVFTLGARTPKALRREAQLRTIFTEAGLSGDDLERAQCTHWAFILGGVALENQQHRRDQRAGLEAVPGLFEFRLEAWIAGIRHMADRGSAATPATALHWREQAREPERGLRGRRVASDRRT
jgi:AcrR family transcriptional regulator